MKRLAHVLADLASQSRGHPNHPRSANPEMSQRAVQGTNDAACRSKASMESLGYLAPFYKAPFSHHFVAKLDKSRASLINRGYALRVMIIRESLKGIIERGDDWQVVGLGAGFDTTFFWIADNDLVKGRLNYIEVDLPDVIEQKRAIIEQCTVLSSLLNKNHNYKLHSLPLDLRSIQDHSLQDVIDPNLPTIFISECVLSYLDTCEADKVLKWAANSTIFADQRHLILYEQLLATDNLLDPIAPPIHDKFTETMLAHFEALKCPLKSSHPYSTIHMQMDRFRGLGWNPSIYSIDEACNSILTPEMQCMIDGNIIDDQFDEEEEMAIKKSHYFLCTATVDRSEPGNDSVGMNGSGISNWTPPHASTKCLDSTMLWGHASCLFDSGQGLLVFGGYGRPRNCPTQNPARLNQLLVIATTRHTISIVKQDSHPPEPRLFSTIHLIREDEKCSTFYMFGGRAAPNRVLPELWQLDLVKNASNEYTASWTLLSTEAPFISTRHQSIYYKDKLFVFDAVNPLIIFHDGKWRKPRVHPELHFATSHPFTVTLWRDRIHLIGSHNLQLDPNTLACMSLRIHSQSIHLPAIRYHTAMPIDAACWHGLILLGGLTKDLDALSFAFRPELTIIYIDLVYNYWMPIHASGLHSLVKHSSALIPRGDAGFDILTVGGGSVCFSMGSYNCNTMCITVELSIPILPSPPLLLHTQEPVILRGLPLGPCLTKWTIDYIKGRGPDEPVSAHICTSSKMSFCPRNFEFGVMPWSEMIDRCLNKEFIYFRAIGSNPRKNAAHFHESFPGLAQDVVVPEGLFPREAYFSSVLRVSAAGMTLWTHYDVMDNVLIQVIGRKRITLWHPNDIPYLHIEVSSSRVIDIQDTATFPSLLKSRPRTVILEPGDVLHIPALWFHHVECLPSDPSLSVAVNIFWRALPTDMYPRKDLYGNADLVAFAEAERAVQGIRDLPEPYRSFYLYKLLPT